MSNCPIRFLIYKKFNQLSVLSFWTLSLRFILLHFSHLWVIIREISEKIGLGRFKRNKHRIENFEAEDHYSLPNTNIPDDMQKNP